MRALLAVADATLGAALARGLLHAGIDVAIETSYAEARVRATGERFDAVVFDAAFPGGGSELCRELRRRGDSVSIIMLTDADSIADRVRARDACADTYLAKPVSARELLDHLRAPRLQNPPDAASDRVVVADLVIDVPSRVVWRAEQRIRLTRKEFALLQILARHGGRPVDRPTIIAHVWSEGIPSQTNIVDVLVGRLRRKIDVGHEQPLVQTHRGVGYRLGV